MALNFSKEQTAEIFEHIHAIGKSMARMRADIREINACFDRMEENIFKPARLRRMLGIEGVGKAKYYF